MYISKLCIYEIFKKIARLDKSDATFLDLKPKK